MEALIRKYAEKIVARGLAEEGEPLLGGLDADMIWNRRDEKTALLENLFHHLPITALLFCVPREPYRTIIDYLCRTNVEAIYPEDCETRTFFHDLPIASGFEESSLIALLKQRKCALVRGSGIVATGTVSPEQTFITLSSVCFACFVTFFSQMLHKHRQGTLTAGEKALVNTVETLIDSPFNGSPVLKHGPYHHTGTVYQALEEVGREVVKWNLVDSYFGNLSCRHGDILYISQTGSSLDELNGLIDPCPLDGSSCSGLTASSELSLHLDIARSTEMAVILHGHPRFSVIMSMDCDRYECEHRGGCHRNCPRERYFDDIPIVSGEVGRGPYGLYRTVPAALKNRGAAIVYGHGTFTTGLNDFNEAFHQMLSLENRCREEFFRRINS